MPNLFWRDTRHSLDSLERDVVVFKQNVEQLIWGFAVKEHTHELSPMLYNRLPDLERRVTELDTRITVRLRQQMESLIAMIDAARAMTEHLQYRVDQVERQGNSK